MVFQLKEGFVCRQSKFSENVFPCFLLLDRTVGFLFTFLSMSLLTTKKLYKHCCLDDPQLLTEIGRLYECIEVDCGGILQLENCC